MKELFIRPGKVAKEFNEGARKRYFNPITYLLLIMALQIYLAKKTDIYTAYLDDVQHSVQKMQQGIPKDNQWNSDKMMEEQKINNPKVLEHNRTLNLIFLPVLAFLTWLFFKKSGFNYAENLVFNVFYLAQLLLFFILIIVAFVIFPSAIMVLMFAYGLIYVVYTYIAFKQFFQQRWWLTLIKSAIILVVYFFLIDQITNVMIAYL
jgi:hypothetical protein